MTSSHSCLLLLLIVCIASPCMSIYDGSWEQMVTIGIPPEARTWQSGGVIGDRFYVTGGESLTNNNTFVLDVPKREWTELSAGETIKAADCGSVGGVLWSFGGKYNTGASGSAAYTNKLNMFRPSANLGAGQWQVISTQGTVPQGRNAHTMTGNGGMLYVFGGWNEEMYFNDLWGLDTTATMMDPKASYQWVSLTADGSETGPPKRNGHTMVNWGGQLVMYGGFWHNIAASSPYSACTAAAACRFFNDVWILTPPTTLRSVDPGEVWTQLSIDCSKVGSCPIATYGHAAEIIGESMYVFGGHSLTMTVDQLWQLNLATRQWRQLSPVGATPAARDSPIAGTVNGMMVIFGGHEQDSSAWLYRPDTWDYIRDTCANLPQPGPSPAPAPSDCSLHDSGALTLGAFTFILQLVTVGMLGYMVKMQMCAGGGGLCGERRRGGGSASARGDESEYAQLDRPLADNSTEA